MKFYEWFNSRPLTDHLYRLLFLIPISLIASGFVYGLLKGGSLFGGVVGAFLAFVSFGQMPLDEGGVMSLNTWPMALFISAIAFFIASMRAYNSWSSGANGAKKGSSES